MIPVDDATRALAGQLDELISMYQDAVKNKNERKQRNAKRDFERRRIAVEIETLSQIMRGLDRRLAARPNGLFGERCAPCMIMMEWSALASQRESAAKLIDERKRDLAAIGDNEELIDLTPLVQQCCAARAAAESVEREARSDDLRNDFAECQSEIDRLA